MNKPSSPQEKIWYAEYLQCWNATEAARRAKYKHPNTIGPRKLRKFRELIQQNLDKKRMGAEEALERMSEIARGEYAYYIREDGTVDLEQMREDGKLHLVTRSWETKYGRRVFFVDMQDALKDILKVHGQFKTVHQGPDGGPIEIKTDEEHNRAISTLADAIRESISGEGGE